MKDNGSRFYYSRLTDGEKNLYDRICEALLRFEPALSIHAAIGKPKAAAFLRDMTEKTRKQDMSSFVISSQCNNCMAYQAKYKRKTATAK